MKQPTNKRTSKSSLHRPLDLDTPTSEESSASFDQLSVPSFKVFIISIQTNCPSELNEDETHLFLVFYLHL